MTITELLDKILSAPDLTSLTLREWNDFESLNNKTYTALTIVMQHLDVQNNSAFAGSNLGAWLVSKHLVADLKQYLIHCNLAWAFCRHQTLGADDLLPLWIALLPKNTKQLQLVANKLELLIFFLQNNANDNYATWVVSTFNNAIFVKLNEGKFIPCSENEKEKIAKHNAIIKQVANDILEREQQIEICNEFKNFLCHLFKKELKASDKEKYLYFYKHKNAYATESEIMQEVYNELILSNFAFANANHLTLIAQKYFVAHDIYRELCFMPDKDLTIREAIQLEKHKQKQLGAKFLHLSELMKVSSDPVSINFLDRFANIFKKTTEEKMLAVISFFSQRNLSVATPQATKELAMADIDQDDTPKQRTDRAQAPRP